MKSPKLMPVALVLLLPLAAAAAEREPAGIAAEVRQDLAEARSDMRTDLDKARRELETGNLDLGDGLHFGKARRNDALPRAEITPDGDLLIAGKPQLIDFSQRRQLLAYRGKVLEIAKTGIDIGQRSAEAALDAIGDGSVLGLLFGAMTGTLENRIERVVILLDCESRGIADFQSSLPLASSLSTGVPGAVGDSSALSSSAKRSE